MSKELVFKVVMQGDTNNFDTSIRKSKKTAEEMFQEIGLAVEELEKKTKKSSDSTKNIVTTEAQDRVKDLTAELNAATNVIVAMGDKSTISANEIRTMSQQSQKAIATLKDELVAAQAEYLQLSQAKASPQDIGEAIAKITDIKRAIRDVETAFGAYQTVAANAMTGVTNATSSTITEIQKFTSVDLTSVVSEAQNATRAIQSMGDGAVVSTKEVERIGQLGATAVDSLTRELNSARQAWESLSNTNGVDLKELTAAKERVEGLERALSLTESSMDEFRAAAGQTTPVIDQIEKEVEQADQAFNNFTQASSKANQELRETEATSDKAQVGFSVLKTTIGTLTAGLAALGLGLTINELIATSDATQQMASRLRNATDSVEEYNQVQSRLLELANATFRPLAEAQEVYLATAGTMKSLGYSTNEVLTLTDSLALSFTHNATRADQAQSAQDALAQSLAKGSVDADAWMSIITGADNVVGDLARSTGRTESEIRKLGAEGKISVNELTKALIESRDRNFELASAMENSTADAMQQVRNNITALIGQMNEQYNISSRLASVIQGLGGDLDWIAVLFDDVMSAVDALSEEFESIDPTIFESLKQAISSTYDAVKQIGIGLYELGEISIKQLNDGLNNIVAVLGSFTGEATKAGDQVSFLTRTAQGLSITFGAISDMVFALRLVVMTLAGVFYDLGVVINGVLATITFGDVSDQFAANAEKMRLKAKQFYDDVDQLALAHESQAKKRLDEAVESEGQKNARILAENKKALDDLLAIQEQEGQNSDKLQSRKLKAVTDYATEAVQANSGVLSSALELELAQKGYFATVDQGGKVVVTRLTEAEQATAAATLEIKRQEQAFKNASETGQALGVDVQQVTNKISAGFSDNSGKLTAFVGQLKDAGITGTQASDMIYQAWQKWLSQAKNTAEIDEAKKKLMEMGVAGQVTGEQLDAGFKLASEAARDLDPALNDAREAGKALGIDIDKTANFMSQGFGQGSANLDTLKQKLEEAGIKGREASNILYQGWKTWLEKADSQVELDAAKAKFKEFEAQGVFSAKQVENGMLALEIQTSKVKGETDETTEAFKRLGIQTKEQLSLAAKQAMMDFEQVKNSGQATAEGTKQAYEKMSQAVALSGDQAIIAQAKAVGASNGLNMEIDKTGKAVVKTTQEIVDALYPIGSAAESATGRAAQGFRDLGRTAREEAQSSADAWAKAMEEVAAKRAAQTAVTAKGLSELQGGIDQMSEDYFNRLVAAGMDSSRARDLADKAKLSLAQETTDALRGGNQLGVNTTKQQMEKTLAYWENKNSSTGASISLGGNTPVISAPNIEPPQIQQIRMPNIDSGPDKNVRIELAIGNSKSELYGTQAQVDATEELFRQLEEAKKRS